jgi:hypothetical protein
MPFCRDVVPNTKMVHRMRIVLERCREDGGFLCVCREDRQSLLLKQQEMYENRKVFEALADFHKQPVIDILDESDALLSCKQQLVYAWGRQEDLPDSVARWQVAQEVIHVLVTNEEVQSILSDPHVAEVQKHEGRYGAMDAVRLVRGALPDASKTILLLCRSLRFFCIGYCTFSFLSQACWSTTEGCSRISSHTLFFPDP